MYAFRIHSTWSSGAFRLSTMFGTAMFTIVVSSNVMKKPRQSTDSTSHGLNRVGAAGRSTAVDVSIDRSLATNARGGQTWLAPDPGAARSGVAARSALACRPMGWLHRLRRRPEDSFAREVLAAVRSSGAAE